MFKQTFKEQYGNGGGWKALLRVAEIVIPLYLAWFFTTSGMINQLKGKVDQLCTQTAALAASVDRHIQDYDIHVPHRAR